MKKEILSLTILALSTITANAQLTVYSDGNVGIATDDATLPESTLSINGGKEGYDLSVVGTQRGIFGASYGEYLGWSYGVYGKNYYKSASFQNGVAGIADLKQPQSSCRTYGVIGIAGNATSGWNYGVYGQLNGANNGAGVYGTANSGENGSCVDGRYAGFFNGQTKVKGDLIVTGSIKGVILNNTSKVFNTYSLESENSQDSFSDRLSKLSATYYYEDSPIVQTMTTQTDTACINVTTHDIQGDNRIHYSLELSQLKESFPELIYEQEDGTIGINYIEMIPILIQEINNLKSEISSIKSNNSYLESEHSNSSVPSVVLRTDGKIIGSKRANIK